MYPKPKNFILVSVAERLHNARQVIRNHLEQGIYSTLMGDESRYLLETPPWLPMHLADKRQAIGNRSRIILGADNLRIRPTFFVTGHPNGDAWVFGGEPDDEYNGLMEWEPLVWIPLPAGWAV